MTAAHAAYWVWRRELRVTLRAPILYVVGGLFLVVQGLAFAALVGALSDPRRPAPIGALLEGQLAGTLLTWVLSLVVLTLLGMRTIAEERRTGGWELLITAGVTEGAAVVGTWLAAVTLYAVLWLPTLSYFAVVAAFRADSGGWDVATIATGYAGAIALGAALLAWAIAASAATTSSLAAGGLGFALLIGLFLVGELGSVWPELAVGHPAIAAVVSALSVRDHVAAMARGELGADTAVLFGGLAAVGLSVAVTAACAGRRRRDQVRARGLATVLIAVIAVLAGVVVHRHPARCDVSASRRNTLDPDTVAVLDALPAPARVTIIEPTLGALDPVFDEIARVAARIAEVAPAVTVTRVDPAAAPGGLAAVAHDAGLLPGDLARGGAVVVEVDQPASPSGDAAGRVQAPAVGQPASPSGDAAGRVQAPAVGQPASPSGDAAGRVQAPAVGQPASPSGDAAGRVQAPAVAARRRVVDVLALATVARGPGDAPTVERLAAEQAIAGALAELSVTTPITICATTGHGELPMTRGAPGAADWAAIADRLRGDGARIVDVADGDALSPACSAIAVIGPATPLPATTALAIQRFVAGGGGLLVAAASRPVAGAQLVDTGLDGVLAADGLGLPLAIAVDPDPDAALDVPGALRVVAGYADHPINTGFAGARSLVWYQPRVVSVARGAHALVSAGPHSWGELDLVHGPPAHDADDLPGPVALAAVGARHRVIAIGSAESLSSAVLVGGASAGDLWAARALRWLAGAHLPTVMTPARAPEQVRLLLSPGERRAVIALATGGIPLAWAVLGGGLLWWRRRRAR